MIPGESNGTESTVRPLSSVVRRIGNGKTFSSSRPEPGAAPMPSTSIGKAQANRNLVIASLSRKRLSPPGPRAGAVHRVSRTPI